MNNSRRRRGQILRHALQELRRNANCHSDARHAPYNCPVCGRFTGPGAEARGLTRDRVIRWRERTSQGTLSMTQKMPHVAVLIETSRSFTRAELRGVKRYITEHGPWSVYLEMRALDSALPQWLRRWRGDGILARSASQQMIDLLRATGAPCVELRASKLAHEFPFVGVDNRVIGRLVAEHFIERGFRHFAISAIETETFFEERAANFIETVKQAGYDCFVDPPIEGGERPRQWERQQERLAKWIAELPKPVGIMACTDQLGFWILDACKRATLAVPEEVAVVGVENDEAICSMASPPLSSVEFAGARMGYEAAALLDRMMQGEKPTRRETLIEPLGIVTRQSSDIVAIEDEIVTAAVRFIREHACEGISIRDVAQAVQMSRSTLERRFQAALERTPNDEIHRVQLRRIEELLLESELPIAAIARRSGFTYPQYMTEFFKRHHGCTPADFRRAAKP